jgi:hypothetical protein
MKRLTEAQVRQVIKEEIKSYLFEQDESFFDKYHKVTTPAGIALLGILAGTTYNPEAQATEEVYDTSGLEQLQNIIDDTEQQLVNMGVVDQYAQNLISRTVEYGNLAFEKEVRRKGIKDQDRAKEYQDFMIERFEELQNQENLSKVAAQDFLTQAESVGTHQIMSAQIEPQTGKTNVGSPVPAYSLQVAFANEMLKIVTEEEKLPEGSETVYTDMIVGSFNKESNAYIVKPNILPFFDQVAVENSPFEAAILSIIPQVKVDAPIFEEEQNNNAMERINKELGAEVKNKKSIEENKVNKLRQRINELRGVYV